MSLDPVHSDPDAVSEERPAPEAEVPAPARAEEISPPDLGALSEVLRTSYSLQSVALVVIAVLGLVYTLYFARSFFLPVTIALLLKFLLSPAVRRLQRLRMPTALAAALTLGILLAGLIGLLYMVAEPAREWLAQTPEKVELIERKLRRFRQPVEEMGRAAEQMGELTRVGESDAGPVQLQEPSALSALLSGGQRFVAGAAVMLILLFFLLATEDMLLRKLVRMLPRLGDRKKAVGIARQIEQTISTHLLTVSVINLCLGLAVAGALYLLGMSNPLLWGALAAALNFIPYLGAMVGTVILTGASLLAFDDLLAGLLVPAAYLLLTALEGGVITPVILGRRLSLNPVAVFLGLFFWGWLWGIAGALMAVPLMVSLKVFCDHIEPLAPLGELLGA